MNSVEQELQQAQAQVYEQPQPRKKTQQEIKDERNANLAIARDKKAEYAEADRIKKEQDKLLKEKIKIEKFAKAVASVQGIQPIQSNGKTTSSDGLYNDQIDNIMSRYKDFRGCI